MKPLAPRVKIFALACLGATLTWSANADPILLANYKFNGNGEDDLGNSSPMEVSGFSFTNGAIHLTDVGFGIGYLPGTAKINDFSYNSFTVALDFNPSSLAYPHGCILSGGPAYRWIVFEGDDFGERRLQIRLNNGNPLFVFTNAVELNRWHTLVCSVNLATQRIVTFLDGERLADIELQSFQFEVVGTASEQSDKVFSFRNYGNATQFQGLADNLRVYNRALSPAEIASRYSARLGIQPSGQAVLVYWPADLTGYVLEAADATSLTVPWLTDNRTPLTIGNQNLILEERATGSKFYRLRRQ